MGRFKSLVGSPLKIELFKQKYNILQEVGLRYCSTEQIVTDRETGEVIIPMIAFMEGGMTIPMRVLTVMHASLLEHLVISDCQSLKCVPLGGDLFAKLKFLQIRDCSELTSLSSSNQLPMALKQLEVYNCPKLRVTGGQLTQ